MTVMELMESVRPGFQETGLAIEWIKQALIRIEHEYPQSKTKAKIDIVKGQRLYPLPSDVIKITRVLQYTGKENVMGHKIYKPIPPINNTQDILEEA